MEVQDNGKTWFLGFYGSLLKAWLCDEKEGVDQCLKSTPETICFIKCSSIKLYEVVP